jgi:hypothetical protein
MKQGVYRQLESFTLSIKKAIRPIGILGFGGIASNGSITETPFGGKNY